MKNKNFYIIIFAVTFLFFAIIVLMPKSLVSSTNSSYRTELTQSDEAAVAKWNIVSLDKDGTALTMDVAFSQKIDEDSNGNWFFEISNQSEVVAKLNSDSKIVLKLYHENFLGLNDTISWNFLGGNNPINFKVYLYNKTLDEVLMYSNNEKSIPYSEYNKLFATDKTSYDEKIDESGVCVFDTTNIADNSIKKKIDNGTTYYELECEFSDKNDYNIDINKKLTIRLEWNISMVDDSGNSSVISSENNDKYYNYYKLIKEEEIDSTMSILDETSINGYEIEGQNYYIVYQEKSYFDYLNCFGHEPLFSFSTAIGGKEKVAFSKLTDEQKLQITSNVALSNNPSYSELFSFVEKKTYEQFVNFQEDVEKYERSQGYLGYGLTCNIQFALHVSQID